MRVTLISLWPRGAMLHYACQLANALAESEQVEITILLPCGSETHLLTAAVQRSFADVALHGGRRHVLGNLRRLLRLGDLLRAIRRSRPDVIHVNSSHPLLIAALPLLSRGHLIFATVHDLQPHPGEHTLRKQLERWVVLRYAQRIAVHSQQLKDGLLALHPGRRPEDVVITPHGDYGFYGSVDHPPAPARPTVLFFGRILSYKGLEYLLQAAPQVRLRVPDVHFVIAGEGDLSPYAALLTDPSLIEVKNGYIPDEEVGKLFRHASLLALPYVEASWSGIIGIARSFSLPIVATRVGCLPEAVEDGKVGLVVPPRDVPALANAIVRILSDQELRHRLAVGSRAARNAGGWDRAAKCLVDAYVAMGS